MSDGSYPDKEEREAQHTRDKEMQEAYERHQQPCPCVWCYVIRTDREWREDD